MGSNFEENLVSVIMPAYNSEKYIESSIQSVIDQIYTNWELIVIDDCSMDRTAEIVQKKQEQDKRIKYLLLEKNSGVAQARNEGVKSAKGQYIAFLDSDDIWLEEKLAHQIQFMQEKQAPISFTQYRQFCDDISNIKSLLEVKEIVDYKTLLQGNIIGCLTVVIDRNYIPQITMPQRGHEDYIAWLNILKQGFKAYGLKEDLARYRKNQTSLSGNKFKSIAWTWDIYRKEQKLSLVESLYYMMFYLSKAFVKTFNL